MSKYISLFQKQTKAPKDDKSFFSTLLFSFLTTAIISSLLLTFFLSANYMSNLIKNLSNYNRQLLAQTNYAINQMDEKVERLALYLMNSNAILAFLSLNNGNSTAPVLASQEVNNQLMILPFVESIYLYNSSMNLIYSSATGAQSPMDTLENRTIASQLNDYEFLMNHTGKPIVTSKDNETGSAEIISYYFPDNHAVDKTDVIVINVHVSAVTDSISSIKNFTSGADTGTSFALFDSQNNYLAGVPDADFPILADSNLEQISSNYQESNVSFLNIGDVNYFLVNTNDNVYEWHLLNFIPIKEIVHNIVIITVWSLFILICVFLFMFIICLRFANSLNGPIKSLELILKGKTGTLPQSSLRPKEFQTILSSVSALQQNNKKLHLIQQKSKYSLTQACLNSLVMNHNLDSPNLTDQKLEQLELTYLKQDKLCMAVFKIDCYHSFFASRNPEELWVVRFSAVNIIEELASAHFTCNAFSRDNDKFVLLISCESEHLLSDFEEKVLDLFHSIQENLHTYLKFTVTVAYSRVFQTINNLPVIYKNMESLLLLKIRYGHGAVIGPYQDDETDEISFQLSFRGMNQLIDRIANAQKDSAWEGYLTLTKELAHCDYNEIISSMIHMIYSIYERISEKYPMLRDFLMQDLKNFLPALEQGEVFLDIQDLMKDFIDNTCSSIQKLKENPSQQNTSIVTEKATNIILRDYGNPALCLCSIAEEIGLSANYTGQIFKQSTQKSISQYILEVRMDKLAEYLQTTSLPLNKILEDVGLEKNNYFYTRFKNYFGMSLNEYRQQIVDASKENT